MCDNFPAGEGDNDIKANGLTHPLSLTRTVSYSGEMFVWHTTDEFVPSPFFSPTAAISACACLSASWRHPRPGDRSPLAQPLAKPRRQGAGALPPATACPTVPRAMRLSPRSLDYAGAPRPARPDPSFAAAQAFCA
jgi:hypothetical protein